MNVSIVKTPCSIRRGNLVIVLATDADDPDANGYYIADAVHAGEADVESWALVRVMHYDPRRDAGIIAGPWETKREAFDAALEFVYPYGPPRLRLTRRGRRARGVVRLAAIIAGTLLAWQIAGWLADGAARGVG